MGWIIPFQGACNSRQDGRIPLQMTGNGRFRILKPEFQSHQQERILYIVIYVGAHALDSTVLLCYDKIASRGIVRQN